MRLISFLGTNDYKQTDYTLNGNRCKTRYVAAALATLIEPKPNEVIILATEQAEKKHGTGLPEEMRNLNLPSPRFQTIPTGSKAEELWQQFEIISETVTTGDPQAVTLDITHGFRAQPFFAASVVAYLRAIDHKPADFRVHYGEFREKEVESPIWDISDFIALLDWSNALHSFIKTGHGGALAHLAKSENARIRKSGIENPPKKLASLAESLEIFSANIATVRCPQLITGSDKERGSARNVLKQIQDSDAEVKTHLKPLVPILKSLSEKLQDIPSDSLFGESGHKAMSALANLYLQYERYPEALITVREGWISLYAEEGKTDKALLESTKRKDTESHWREAEKTPEERNADDIGGVRNDIEHGGFREAPLSAKALRKQTEEWVERFEGAKTKERN